MPGKSAEFVQGGRGAEEEDQDPHPVRGAGPLVDDLRPAASTRSSSTCRPSTRPGSPTRPRAAQAAKEAIKALRRGLEGGGQRQEGRLPGPGRQEKFWTRSRRAAPTSESVSDTKKATVLLKEVIAEGKQALDDHNSETTASRRSPLAAEEATLTRGGGRREARPRQLEGRVRQLPRDGVRRRRHGASPASARKDGDVNQLKFIKDFASKANKVALGRAQGRNRPPAARPGHRGGEEAGGGAQGGRRDRSKKNLKSLSRVWISGVASFNKQADALQAEILARWNGADNTDFTAEQKTAGATRITAAFEPHQEPLLRPRLRPRRRGPRQRRPPGRAPEGPERRASRSSASTPSSHSTTRT